ncbi:T9SS type A sorting domain-containing protein [Ferruginibacter sp. SUN002]|uniref:T9SS type A sorting domain-containing protein n=1 Tax=Ferruginibacter sp. SUN002 TaxID=2937789 RepID=UPI003D35BFAD
MKIFTQLQKNGLSLCAVTFLLLTSFSSTAQVIRSYDLIYSNNLKGGHTAFGNTVMQMESSNGTVLTDRHNDFGSYSNGATSQYGNDGSNMQYVDIDGVNPTATLVNYGSSWTYSNANSQPAGWPNVSSLPGGPGAAPLGYGPTGTVNTTLTDRRTYYFTQTVNINTATYENYTFNLKIDDGAVVYVNGTEVGRINMDNGTPDYSTNSSDNTEPEEISSFTVNAGAPFVNGNNVIQVEVHTSASNESGTDDLYFDFELLAGDNPTFNSSSADLILPSTGTNTIKFARLYWGGRVSAGAGVNDFINLRTIQIRKGNSGAYLTGIAPLAQIDKANVNSGSDTVYQAYVDVTDYVKNNGAGTYTVANVSCATGSISGGGHYGGWSIVVVYENPTSTYSSVRVYDGYLQVFDDGSAVTQSITLTGLNAPSTPLSASDAYMTALSWEGDANLAASSQTPAGDYVKLNGVTVSDARNPANNFWNGTISKNGADVTTKFPNYINQFGLDLDEMEVGTGYGIVPNATQATVEFGTEADQYFPSVFAFTMKTKEPSIFIDKAVQDANFPLNVLTPNEVLTYTLSGSNVGVGPAYNCVIIDTIPSNVIYVPNSLEIISSPGGIVGPKTDNPNDADEAFKTVDGGKFYIKYFIGTGATSTQGGVLQSGESYAVRFKVMTPAVANQVSSVINLARIVGNGISGDPYVDDATAIIGPQGGSLAVKISKFNVSNENGSAVLRWTTVSEDKNDHFDIEQSLDGINFTKVGTVTGNGTSTLVNNYQFSNFLWNTSVKVFYYRLKIFDKEANVSVTNVVSLHLNGTTTIKNFAVYPNPFISNIKMQIHSDFEEATTVRIMNLSGQAVVKRNIILQPNDNIVVIKDLDGLSSGIYTVEVATRSGVITQKIIKK